MLAIHLSHWYNNAQRLPVDPQQTIVLLRKIAERSGRLASTGHLLLMNGVDHLEAQENLTAALGAVRPLLPEGTELVHSDLERYVAAVMSEAPELNSLQGELREGDEHHILNGTLSARSYIKQLSYENQELLERTLEPLAVRVAAYLSCSVRT